MDFRVLGPVQAWVDGRPVQVGVRKQRLVLAVLVLAANFVVSPTRLIALMWPDRPPRTARAVLHTHVSRVRAMLTEAGAARYGVELVSDGAGYSLRCDPLRVDAHRFRALHARADAQTDDAIRVDVLKEALALWRGPVLAGVADDEVRGRLGNQLDDLRLAALEDVFDAELRLGRHRAVVDEIAASAAEHPHRQHFSRQLMIALHRCDRTVEALRVYRDLYRVLEGELGIAPAAELQRLHCEILRG
ncbi:MAG: hypothetical protein QOF58_4162 [Pseudonocardiales bacterium]|nr:hypothetical protein [Pseudonocardiales bacterium]